MPKFRCLDHLTQQVQNPLQTISHTKLILMYLIPYWCSLVLFTHSIGHENLPAKKVNIETKIDMGSSFFITIVSESACTQLNKFHGIPATSHQQQLPDKLYPPRLGQMEFASVRFEFETSQLSTHLIDHQATPLGPLTWYGTIKLF